MASFQTTPTQHFPPPSPGDIVVNDNLMCGWQNKTQGRCRSEVDFIVTFQAPPCGHEQAAVGQIARFCGRHMLRAMFTILTQRRCERCGQPYQGLAMLKMVNRL